MFDSVNDAQFIYQIIETFSGRKKNGNINNGKEEENVSAANDREWWLRIEMHQMKNECIVKVLFGWIDSMFYDTKLYLMNNECDNNGIYVTLIGYRLAMIRSIRQRKRVKERQSNRNTAYIIEKSNNPRKHDND